MTDPSPPLAPIRPTRSQIHGIERIDEFAWLRDREDPEVRAYLDSENRYANQVLEPTAELQERLYREMLARIKQTDLSVPYRDGEWWYYSRTTEGLQYPVYCRQRSEDAPEHVVLDLNALAGATGYLAIGAFVVSDDGQRLAYSTDETGFREYRLQIKDLERDEVLPGVVEHSGSIAWSKDGTWLFYSVEDASKRHHRIYRAPVTEEGLGEGELVLEENDQAFSVHIQRSRCKAWLILTVESHTTSEVRCLRADEPFGDWRLIAPRTPDREYDVAPHGGHLFIRINDTGRNFRLVRTSWDDLAPDRWTEILPHAPDRMLEGFGAFEHHLVVWERRDGLQHVRILRPTGEPLRELNFPDAIYEVTPGQNREWGTRHLRFRYESPLTPPTIFDEDVFSGDRVLRKQTEVLGDFQPSRYRTERALVPTSDGVQVPVSLILPAERESEPIPFLVEGYGAYGIPYPLSFSSNRLSLLDRGVGIAIAHVRGGGELGKSWHDAGRMEKKERSFDDFLSVLTFLVDQKWTTRDRLVIEGGSAGGLLIGAVLNRDPACCRAALLQVPFVDVINTMLDSSLPLTVGEFEEWGNPSDPEEFRWLEAYCPYTNLQAAEYPAMLVRTSFHDSQVMYWEPAKYVARLRRRRTNDRPVLLVTNMGAGHGGSSGRYDRLREIALDYAFILWQVERAA